MRVVAGTAKGTKLLAVPGDTTRPILDRVKVALFDVLRPRLAEIKVLDLFAGTGQVGIEALSQGAGHVTFIDATRSAVETIKKNLAAAKLNEKAEVRHTDAFTFLRNTSRAFDLIYVAPPQFEALWIQAVRDLAERPQLLNPGGLIIVQIDNKEYEPLALSAFRESEQRKYGSTLLVFFEPVVQSSPT